MTAIKEKLIGAIPIMSDNEAKKLWEMIERDYVIIKKYDEVIPTTDEKKILDAYEQGEERYQPYMTQEELLSELEIDEL